MGKVINLLNKNVAPYLEGKARCLVCNHEWVAISSVGIVFLKCPNCGVEKGVFISPVERGKEMWHCLCGNELFNICPEGIYCPSCGLWQGDSFYDD